MGASGGDYLHDHHPFKGKGKNKGTGQRDQTCFDWQASDIRCICGITEYFSTFTVAVLYCTFIAKYEHAILKGHGNETDLLIPLYKSARHNSSSLCGFGPQFADIFEAKSQRLLHLGFSFRVRFLIDVPTKPYSVIEKF